jgi:dienelactone hydrolase
MKGLSSAIVPQGTREVLPDCAILSRMNGRRLALVAVLATAVTAGCAGKTSFDNATPGTPQRIEGKLYKPDGPGPFPALVLLHGCQGVLPQTQTWARWLRERGYVALVTDSFGPRHDPADCKGGEDSGPSTARFDDAIGALRYLQTQPFVIPDRVASFGWSQGGLFAMSVINGPTLERARARGVDLPRVGYAAAIAMYPGGCEEYAKELVIRPLLLLIGGADDWTPPQYCREMAAAMKARGADVTLVEYPGAYHYFDVVGQKKNVLRDIEQPYTPGTFGVTIAYDPAAAANASRRLEDFLTRTLKAAPAR